MSWREAGSIYDQIIRLTLRVEIQERWRAGIPLVSRFAKRLRHHRSSISLSAIFSFPFFCSRFITVLNLTLSEQRHKNGNESDECASTAINTTNALSNIHLIRKAPVSLFITRLGWSITSESGACTARINSLDSCFALTRCCAMSKALLGVCLVEVRIE